MAGRDVRGARVLITGAASGMGLLYAKRAVAERARDVVLWDVNDVALAAAVDVLEAASAGTRVHSYVVDLVDAQSVKATADRVKAEVGTPDILINNAGIVRGAFYWEHTSSDIETTIKVNSIAPMLVTSEFLPAMIARKRAARIVNIASAAGLFANPRMSVYAASKWAVIGWSESLRLELAQQGHDQVKVTTVAPSYVSTGMFEGARGPLLTPIMTPEYVVERVWRAMLAGDGMLMLPWSVGLAKVLRGVLPGRVWDRVADSFNIYSSMSGFTGR